MTRPRLILMLGALLGVFALSGDASAAKTSKTCTGTTLTPGVLTGSYFGPVTIQGVCKVDAGKAVVKGRLTLKPGSVLLAAYALNDVTKSGTSGLLVNGEVVVQAGAALLLGCEAEHFACLDDPSHEHPTLSAHERISGPLREFAPLGVIVHDTAIYGNVTELGGGGGLTCKPAGIFETFGPKGSPVYSDYEDTNVYGHLEVKGLTSCWLGAARDHIHGQVDFFNDQLADPDAIEILSNTISGRLNCKEDSRVWDSSEQEFEALFPRVPMPNTVHGNRLNQCKLASPTKEGGPPGPGPF